MSRIAPSAKDRALCSRLAAIVAKRTGVDVPDLLGRRRTPRLAAARRELYYALRCEGLSYPEIGGLLDRDHTTVLTEIKRRAAFPWEPRPDRIRYPSDPLFRPTG